MKTAMFAFAATLTFGVDAASLQKAMLDESFGAYGQISAEPLAETDSWAATQAEPTRRDPILEHANARAARMQQQLGLVGAADNAKTAVSELYADTTAEGIAAFDTAFAEVVGMPVNAAGVVLVKAMNGEEIDWKDAKQFVSLIPGVKDAMETAEIAGTLIDRYRRGDNDACYRDPMMRMFRSTVQLGRGGEAPASQTRQPTPTLRRARQRIDLTDAVDGACLPGYDLFAHAVCLKGCESQKKANFSSCGFFCATPAYCGQLKADALGDLIAITTTIAAIVVQGGIVTPVQIMRLIAFAFKIAEKLGHPRCVDKGENVTVAKLEEDFLREVGGPRELADLQSLENAVDAGRDSQGRRMGVRAAP